MDGLDGKTAGASETMCRADRRRCAPTRARTTRPRKTPGEGGGRAIPRTRPAEARPSAYPRRATRAVSAQNPGKLTSTTPG